MSGLGCLVQILLFMLLCLLMWFFTRGIQLAWVWSCVLCFTALFGGYRFYLFWQARHPSWWAPWDDGLPQTMRVKNVFVAVAMVFTMAVILLPVWKQAQQKRQRNRQQRNLPSTAAPAKNG